MALPNRELQRQQPARPVAYYAQLGGQPAAVAPEALGFFFATPAAPFVWPTVVESTSHVSKSSSPS
ncbi:hypothetical protein GCM10027346_04080 [Hymenobacter seoulensis]